jgi:uncharacterized repeat protein (TIGR03843 family)
MINPTDPELLRVLNEGQIEVQGEFLWGSNYTFFVQLKFNETEYKAVYKPTRGERPLWDFPSASLGRREAAAYLVSNFLGWELVPPTVFRRKGPIGGGSLQWYVEHDPNYHYFTFNKADLQRLRPTVLFDLIINNADRKGSHILKDKDEHLWLIDHGLCFHVEDKLRTVIWDFIGEKFPTGLCDDMEGFRLSLAGLTSQTSEVSAQLLQYLNPAELRALARRIDNLLAARQFPAPDPSRRPYPWPQV